MKIIVDNGHGEDTPGKRSPVWPDGSQLLEWEFNRDVARRIVAGLALRGVDAVLLTPERGDVPLAERTERANRLHRATPDGVALISVHANAGGGAGWECYTSRGRSVADVLAEGLCRHARLAFPGRPMRFDRSDGDGDREADFYLLRHTLCPAVLTENFFMDNEDECRLLASDHERERIAEVHIAAATEFLGLGV